MLRNIIEIDESKCDGCGDCIPSCAEGALAVVGGKVKLVRDVLCDGLGACLGTCAKGALRVVERDAAAFDHAAVEAHLAGPARRPPEPLRPPMAAHHPPAMGHGGGGCPGSRQMEFKPRAGLAVLPGGPPPGPARAPAGGSQLSQWPVQLHLVSPAAPYFRDADLLVAADCVPFAYARFHEDLLAGKRLVIGCPKLDDIEAYAEKLTDIMARGGIRSVTVAKMVVPCCGGIAMAARQAMEASGVDVPYQDVTIGIEGDILG